MDVKDFFPQGTGYLVRLREKGGKCKQIACHHLLEECLCAYIAAAGIAAEPDAPLFRTARGRTGTLTANRMSQPDAWRMLQRRARGAGVDARLCNHTWRARDGAVHGRARRPAHDPALRPPPAAGDPG